MSKLFLLYIIVYYSNPYYISNLIIIIAIITGIITGILLQICNSNNVM